jgi:hypothetical protein
MSLCREKVAQEWRDYYREIGKYERWKYIQNKTKYFIRAIESETQRATGAERGQIQELFALLSELQRIANEGEAKFAFRKPERPLGLDRALPL